MFCLDEFVGGHVELYLTLCCCCSCLYADIPYFAQNDLVWMLSGRARKEMKSLLNLFRIQTDGAIGEEIYMVLKKWFYPNKIKETIYQRGIRFIFSSKSLFPPQSVVDNLAAVVVSFVTRWQQ